MPDAPAPTARWFGPALMLLGSAGFAAAWVLLALMRDQQCSWMAVLAAVDAVLLLRLARMPAGLARALLALAGTALAIVLANWWIAAAQIGEVMGLLPWQSILKLGPSYAWTLASLANQALDLAWLGLALLLAAIAGR